MLYTHKRDSGWLFPEEKSIADRRLSSTQILEGGSREDGPLTPLSGSLKSCLSFSLHPESCWPIPKALALLSSPHREMTEYSSRAWDLLHPLKPLISQVHAHIGREAGGRSKAKGGVSKASHLHSEGNENHWVQTRADLRVFLPRRKQTHSSITLGFTKEKLLAREIRKHLPRQGGRIHTDYHSLISWPSGPRPTLH